MPGLTVINGAVLVCDVGSQPVQLSVTSNAFVTIDGELVATVMDMNANTNIPALGTCEILSGIAGSPVNCAPKPTGPWDPGSSVQTINGLAVLTMPATCACAIGGTISVSQTPQIVEDSM